MMLSRFFGKSKPFVFLCLIGYLSLGFWISAMRSSLSLNWAVIGKYVVLISLLFGVNFIVKRNKINKQNAFAVFVFTMLSTFFPDFYLDFAYLIPAFFVVLGLRRLISLKTQIEPKKKIFDASLWFFIACIFQPFLLPLVLLVFLAVIQYTLYDPKNLLIPFIAWICGGLFFTAFQLWKTDEWIFFYELYTGFGWNNFSLIWQENTVFISAFTILSLFVLFGISKVINSAALALKTSLVMVLFAFIFILLGWMLSNQNTIAGLAIAFIPLSMLAGKSLEIKIKPILKEGLLWLFLGINMLIFFI